VRNARPGIQLFEYTMHELASDRCQRRVTDSTRFLLSRSITVIRPVRSSQTRKRAKTRTPLRRSEMNRATVPDRRTWSLSSLRRSYAPFPEFD
jgi:hypothetical protein